MHFVSILTITLLCALPTFAQPPKAPASLDAIPKDGFGFVSINIAELYDSEVLKSLITELSKGEKSMLQMIEQNTGVSPGNVKRLTLFYPGFNREMDAPAILLTFRKPYDKAQLYKTFEVRSLNEDRPRRVDFPPPFPEKNAFPPKEQFPPKDEPIRFQRELPPMREVQDDIGFSERLMSILILIDDSTVLFLSREFGGRRDSPVALAQYLAKSLKAMKQGALAEALEVAEQHTIVAAVDAAPMKKMMMMEMRGELPRELLPFEAMLETQRGMLTFDLAAKSKLTAKLKFPNEAAAKKAEPVLKTLLQLASNLLGTQKKEFEGEKERAAVMGPVIDFATQALDNSEVKNIGSELLLTMNAEVGTALQKAIVAMPEYARVGSNEAKSMNNLKQIMLAFHNYESANGFLPGDVVDKNGKALMSWRVQLLPYLEQENLYRQLDFTKSWDDPKNAKVLAKMPAVFKIEGREATDANSTYFQLFTSPKALEGGSPYLIPGLRRRFISITDGSSNTFGVVEATDAVNWAKPGDMTYDPKKLPAIGNPKTGKFFAGMMDGYVGKFDRKRFTDDMLKGCITVDGGEIVNIPAK